MHSFFSRRRHGRSAAAADDPADDRDRDRRRRGADALLASGRITHEMSSALEAEARRRSDAGEFFGHIAYASLTAQKSA